jgi:hypothetical protein
MYPSHHWSLVVSRLRYAFMRLRCDHGAADSAASPVNSRKSPHIGVLYKK